jgi:3-oxoacyl-[acyl-carrier-protein] synthase II
MSGRSVVITGFGVVSPLGNSIDEVAARFAAGEQAVRPLTAFGLPSRYGAAVDEIPMDVVPPAAISRIGRLDRLCRLCLPAAYLAVDAAGLQMADEDPDRVGLSLGTGLGCLLTNAEYNQKIVDAGPAAASPRLFAYTVSSAATGEVSIALGIKGVNVTMHAGFAAGLQAIGYATDLIASGKADVVLAGGADALGDALVGGLENMGLLRSRPAVPFGDAVPGLEPSEGAVVAVVEAREHARRRGARSVARIESYAMGFEPTLTRPDRCATGIRRVMEGALERAGRAPSEIGTIITSAHGTPVDATEAQALSQVFGAQPGSLRLFAPKSAWGECFAASGALGVVLAAAGFHRRLPSDGALTIHGNSVRPAPAAPANRPGVALVHALCYSGTTVALLVGQEE